MIQRTQAENRRFFPRSAGALSTKSAGHVGGRKFYILQLGRRATQRL